MTRWIWRVCLLGIAGVVTSAGLGAAAVGCDAPTDPSGAEEESSKSRDDREEESASDSDEPASRPDVNLKSEGKKPDELGEGTEKQRKALAKAKTYFMNDQYERAEPLFEKVVEGGPMSGPRVSAYIALGQIYLRTGRAEKAVELLESMPPPGEKVVEARLVIARAHADQGNTKEAIREFKRVTDLQPNYVFAYPVLGSLYARTGKNKKAAETYLKYENRLETMARVLENPGAHGVADRLNILDFLSAVNDERAVEAVRSALEDPDPRVRARAARMTGTMKIVSAKEQLEELAADDPAKRVQSRAETALQKLEEIESAPERESGFPAAARPESDN